MTLRDLVPRPKPRHKGAQTGSSPEIELLGFLLARLSKHERLSYSKHFREYAAGEPEHRLAIAELIEGRRVTRASCSTGADEPA